MGMANDAKSEISALGPLLDRSRLHRQSILETLRRVHPERVTPEIWKKLRLEWEVFTESLDEAEAAMLRAAVSLDERADLVVKSERETFPAVQVYRAVRALLIVNGCGWLLFFLIAAIIIAIAKMRTMLVKLDHF